MNILKSLIIWFCFIPVAILNGGLREYVLGNHTKRVYFADNLHVIASYNESHYLQRLLADRDMLERFNHSF